MPERPFTLNARYNGYLYAYGFGQEGDPMKTPATAATRSILAGESGTKLTRPPPRRSARRSPTGPQC